MKTFNCMPIALFFIAFSVGAMDYLGDPSHLKNYYSDEREKKIPAIVTDEDGQKLLQEQLIAYTMGFMGKQMTMINISDEDLLVFSIGVEFWNNNRKYGNVLMFLLQIIARQAPIKSKEVDKVIECIEEQRAGLILKKTKGYKKSKETNKDVKNIEEQRVELIQTKSKDDKLMTILDNTKSANKTYVVGAYFKLIKYVLLKHGLIKKPRKLSSTIL